MVILVPLLMVIKISINKLPVMICEREIVVLSEGEPTPLITNILDKDVVPKILEANDCLERNDEEGAKNIIYEMARLGFIQLFPSIDFNSFMST